MPANSSGRVTRGLKLKYSKQEVKRRGNRDLPIGAVAAVIAAGLAISPVAHADNTWSSISIEHNGKR
jgi:hypothetical protein